MLCADAAACNAGRVYLQQAGPPLHTRRGRPRPHLRSHVRGTAMGGTLWLTSVSCLRRWACQQGPVVLDWTLQK